MFSPFHSEAKFALDEGADEEGQEVQSEQCLDAALVLEEDGCNLVHRLDLLEAFFDHRLTLVIWPPENGHHGICYRDFVEDVL